MKWMARGLQMENCLATTLLVFAGLFSISMSAQAASAGEAERQASVCESRFHEAAGLCTTPQTDGVASDQNCTVNGGTNQTTRQLAACKRRQAEEYERAYRDCIADAQEVKRVCGEKQERVKAIDAEMTTEQQAAYDKKMGVPTEVPIVQHMPIKETSETGRKALPELVQPNNSIHDAWHGADDLQSKTAQDLKRHADQLRADADRLDKLAVQSGAATAQPPATQSNSAAAPAAAPSPQAAANAAAKPKVDPEAPKKEVDASISARAASDAVAISGDAMTTGNVAGTLFGGEADAASTAVSSTDSDFAFSSLSSKAGSSESVSASASSGLSSSPASAANSGDESSGAGKTGSSAAGRAPASSIAGSAGGGSRGSRALSLIGDDKKGSASYASSVSAGSTAGKMTGVDLSQFLPGGARRVGGSSSLRSLGIHGPHVNFFSKINERYHYLEDSLDP